MTRTLPKVVAAMVALLVTLPAAAQRYTWTRDFDFLRRTSDNRPLQNVYWASLPLLPSVADIADTGSSLSNKCVGDLDGPSAGDGLVNADDLLCAWWTARSDRATAGTFTIARPIPNRCTFDYRTATVALGTVHFLGVPFDLEQGMGYQVLVSVAPDSRDSPRNRALIAGDDDPGFAGRPVIAIPTCAPGQTTDCCGAPAPRYDLVSVPYDTLYAKADEILCGLEGVDWTDANGNGTPDRCWDDADGNGTWDVGEATTGIFDGRVGMSVLYWANDEQVNAPIARNATIAWGTSLRFTGTPFLLRPGDGYLLTISKTHTPTLFSPPVP